MVAYGGRMAGGIRQRPAGGYKKGNVFGSWVGVRLAGGMGWWSLYMAGFRVILSGMGKP